MINTALEREMTIESFIAHYAPQSFDIPEGRGADGDSLVMESLTA